MRNKAIALKEDKQYELATSLLLETLELAKDLEDFKVQSAVFIELGFIYVESGEYDNARDHFSNVIDSEKELGVDYWSAHARHNLAWTYLEEGKLDKSLKAYNESLAYSREKKDNRNLFFGLLDIGDTHSRMGKTPQALDAWQQAEAYYQYVEPIQEHFVLFKHLSNAYQSLGDDRKSLDYSKQYIGRLEDSNLLQQQLIDPQVTYNVQQMTENYWDRRNQEQLISHTFNDKVFWMYVGSFMLIPSGLLFLLYFRKKKSTDKVRQEIKDDLKTARNELNL